jgi:hypothetical protein
LIESYCIFFSRNSYLYPSPEAFKVHLTRNLNAWSREPRLLHHHNLLFCFGMIWLFIISGFWVECWLDWLVPVWKRNEGHFCIIYKYFPPRVSSKISLWRLYYIFQNLVGLKKRKFYGNIPNRSTTNVYDSGNFEQSGFNVNMDENGVSNVSASSSKW